MSRDEAVAVVKWVSEVVRVAHCSGERAGDTAVVIADRCDDHLGQVPVVGDLSMAARLAEELSHIWPQPADALHAVWIDEPERESILSSDQGP